MAKTPFSVIINKKEESKFGTTFFNILGEKSTNLETRFY